MAGILSMAGLKLLDLGRLSWKGISVQCLGDGPHPRVTNVLVEFIATITRLKIMNSTNMEIWGTG